MRRDALSSWLLLLAGLALVLIPPARAQDMTFQVAGTRLNVRVRSLQDIRDDDVVRQKWDLSCGSAALSTVLTYDWNTPTPETEVVVWILHRTNPVKVQSQGGFSLLDLKRYAQAHGFDAEGYADLSLKDLQAFHSSAIVPVRVEGFNHFVVFRSVIGNRVFLADPAFGNLTVSVPHFLKIWNNGLAFFVFPHGSKPGKGERDHRGPLLVPDGGSIYRATLGQDIFQPARPLE